MTNKNVYPNTFTQTKGDNLVEFGNVKNLKNINSSYSQSIELLQSKKKKPNQPSRITFTNFKCNIPNGSRVTKVTVVYCQQKVPKTQNKYPNIGAPTIRLTGVSNPAKKGKAPTKDKKINKVSWTLNPTLTQINSADFGVSIGYPRNSNDEVGYMRLYYVYLIITYEQSNFTLTMKKVKGGYNKEQYTAQVKINNTKLTGYNPTVTITTPAGFTFQKKNAGEGTIKKINNSTLEWKPRMSKTKRTSTVNLLFDVDVKYPSNQNYYDGVFRAVESLNSHNCSHTAHIVTRPKQTSETEDTTYTDEDISPSSVINPPQWGEDIQIENYTAKVDINGEHQFINTEAVLAWYSEEYKIRFWIWSDDEIKFSLTPITKFYPDPYVWNVNGEFYTEWISLDEYPFTPVPDRSKTRADIRISSKKTKKINVMWGVQYQSIETGQIWSIELKAGAAINFVVTDGQIQSLGTPNYTVMDLSDEETDRLGDGQNYIVQTYMKEHTSEDFVRDWRKNFRIAVFNNPIESNINRTYTENENGEPIVIEEDSSDYEALTNQEMIQNAIYWGTAPSTPNVFESVTCEFTYNKKYPLRIFIMGDFLSLPNIGTLDFTEPCIIESDLYDDYEEPGLYPIKIDDLTLNDGSTAEMTIPVNEECAPIIFSKLPLEEGGTDTTTAIRGLGLEFNVEKTDNIVVYCALKAPNGNTGHRTVVLDEMDTTIDSENNVLIGGIGDLWGFSTNEIIDLGDWEVTLTFQNNLLETDATVNFGNVRFIVYTEEIDSQKVKVSINDEDLSSYGVFVTNVTVPAGLNTDVSYLNVNGTDINDPLTQNIREKTITLELSVDSCDIQTSTDMLRLVTQLFVNQRDEYNKPIPKTLSLSNYPDLAWEYILEEVIDTDVEISDYDLKVKLVVPSGTAYKKKETVTSNIGFVQGLTAVKPVIRVKPNDTNIEINETITQQSFDMGFTGEWNGKIVEIDCNNRRVILKDDEDSDDYIDISRYVNINSDWFRLIGQYDFETTNCTLYTVSYTERW